jgi:hypothetical protein
MVDRASRRCLADEGACGHEVAAEAPLALCEVHLALAAEWVARHAGVTDLLPSPCLACGARVGVRYPSGWICAVCEWRVGEVPDGDLVAPRIDVVYYLRDGDRVKIGTTANPRQRFGRIRHEELLAFERGGRRLEQRRHVEFAADRVGTSEWFWLTPAIVAHVEALGAGAEDPWDLYARWLSAAIAAR